jgi:hypothetical protein
MLYLRVDRLQARVKPKATFRARQDVQTLELLAERLKPFGMPQHSALSEYVRRRAMKGVANRIGEDIADIRRQ